MDLDKRLIDRYEMLVKSHMQVGHELASGVKSLLKGDAAFSQTQAAWRFFNNEDCSLKKLAQPLLAAGFELCEQECERYALVAHDWSGVDYGKHTRKKDVCKIHKRQVGYDLQTSLMLSDRHGGPLSVVALNLKTKEGILSSYTDEIKKQNHLTELSERIQWLEGQGFTKPLVHIVDREADSVAFLRSIDKTLWLIRVNGKNTVDVEGAPIKPMELAKSLSYEEAREVIYKGKRATQHIAQIKIKLVRAAKPRKLGENGKRVARVKGAPVEACLVISRIVDEHQKELAIWYLLSNVSAVSPAQIALWYYWRWSIESYFKLMKSAGMQLESWKQETGKAIARRLMVAGMACVWIWRIAHAKGPVAGEIRRILVRLSGRQMKWKKEFSYPALCAGLWVLLSLEDMLSIHGLDKIKSLISGIFGGKRLV